MDANSSNKNHYIIKLKEHSDNRGKLTVIEALADVPFNIKRVYYEYNTANSVERGNHVNKYSKFGFVSIVGSCHIEVDDGIEKVKYFLDSPTKLLFVNNMIWKTMKNFSKDNVLLVLSDHKYIADEYIKDYEEFKNIRESV